MLIKICGITNLDDALFAEDAGADVLGFVFADSPRQVDEEKAAEIISGLSGKARKAGIFVDEPLERVTAVRGKLGLDLVQLHGEESPDYCQRLSPGVIKLIRVSNDFDPAEIAGHPADFFLLEGQKKDRAGGTGETFLWDYAKALKGNEQIILSGGLNPGNVVSAIDVLCPGGVDVSSGVEKEPGIKDHAKVREFIRLVRKVSSS